MTKLTCPHCGFSKEIPTATIPPRTKQLICPKCRQSFPLANAMSTPEDTQPQPETVPQQPAEVAATVPARRQLASIDELFSNTWRTFKSRILTLLGINLLAIALAVLGFWLLQWGIDRLPNLLGDTPLVTVLAVLVMVGLSLLVFTVIGAATTYAIVDENLGVRPALGCGLQNFKAFTWLYTLLSFIVCGGYLAFFLPGLLFTIWFIFAQYILARDDVRGMDALLKSREYVRGYGWGVAGRILLLGVVGALVSLIPILGALLNLLLIPFSLIYYYEILKDLQRIKPDLSFIASPGVKTRWLLAGAAGYVIAPALLLALLGPALLQGDLQWNFFWSSRNSFHLPPSTISMSTDTDSDAAPQPSSATIHVPDQGENPEQVMVSIYALNYNGGVYFNGEEFYPIAGEKNMNYNFSGSAALQPGSNRFEIDYQALPDARLTELRLKIFRYDWDSGAETVLGEWRIGDEKGRQRYEVILGD